MGIPFDKNDADAGFETPELNKPVRIHIGQCEETRSSNGNDMIVLNCEVSPGQIGAGFKTRFYLVEGRMFNYNCKRIMESCGMDIDAVDLIDDLTFRDRSGVVLFKEEEYQKDGETKRATKIAEWVPAASIAAAEAPSGPEPQPVDDSDIPF